jgi:hypothetical protein
VCGNIRGGLKVGFMPKWLFSCERLL